MLNKHTYIENVEQQLNDWQRTASNLGSGHNDSAFRQFSEAQDLVQTKLNAFRKADDESLGLWETEIDNLRHQAQRLLDTASANT